MGKRESFKRGIVIITALLLLCNISFISINVNAGNINYEVNNSNYITIQPHYPWKFIDEDKAISNDLCSYESIQWQIENSETFPDHIKVTIVLIVKL